MTCQKTPRGGSGVACLKSSQGSTVRSTESRGLYVAARGGTAGASRAARWFGRCFYACGDTGLPQTIDCLGRRYALARVLKHDFVAATALYEAEPAGDGRPDRLICKINRRMHFCLLPLGWFGRLVTHNEACHLHRCKGIDAVPRVVARLSPNSYAYEYVEGKDLSQKPDVPADFFERLVDAVRQIHARNLIHFDLHKPANILVGDDGRPHIIDFQLSTHLGGRFLLSRRLSDRMRRYLQAYDVYHVYKHKRRLQPESLTDAEERLSRNKSLPLRIHRAIARPYKFVRRSCLRYLYTRGILTRPDRARACAETSPDRWMK